MNDHIATPQTDDVEGDVLDLDIKRPR